jgi:ethanolamine permease
MDRRNQVQGVTYRHAEHSYFEKRRLRRHAGVATLWGLAIATVISGNFFGWNFGLTAGGFGGMLVAVLVALALYTGLCLCVAEMSAALPHTGGAYSFGRSAMGPWGGFITGVAETIVYVCASSTVAVGIGGYMAGIAESTIGLHLPQPVWWLIFYGLFLAINVAGVEQALKFALFMALLSIVVLVVFWIGAIPHFDLSNALNIEASDGGNAWFPVGIKGIFFAIPFAAWLFLAIESLPLTAEEAHAPGRAIPRATMLGLLALTVMAFLTVTLSAGTPPGAAVVGESAEPLNEGFTTIFGSVAAPVLALIAVIGLISSFHGVIFAYGRNIYSLSRAGYYPTALSVTDGKRRTPYAGLLAGSVVGYGLAALLYYFGGGSVGAALLSMSVFGAVIAYVMQAISFIRLRKIMPHVERPFVSPLGTPGAVVTALLSIVMGVALFWNPANRAGVVGIAIAYLLAVLYFALVGRNRLVLSPEEQFAMTRGQVDDDADKAEEVLHMSPELSECADRKPVIGEPTQ